MPRTPVADPQPFVVRRSGVQGRGGFATRGIRKGERIVEYQGERISWKTADLRYDDQGMGRHHTFLFSVTSRTVIDGAVQGNDARFINHACDPNCEAIDDGGRIFIEAVRDIEDGDELFYDYAYARDATTTEEDEKLYVCRCGSPKCRGSILEPPPKSRSKKLPKTHHVAARHPHEHLARTREKSAGRASSGASKRASGRGVSDQGQRSGGRKVAAKRRAG